VLHRGLAAGVDAVVRGVGEWMEGGTLRQLDLHSQVTVNNAETYIACALAGLGLVQVPAYDVRQHLDSGELLQVLPQACAPAMPVHLLYPHRRHLSPRMQVFAHWLQALLAPHFAAGT
jgi:LysR family transcriptional regulator for bpeEF and oprC